MKKLKKEKDSAFAFARWRIKNENNMKRIHLLLISALVFAYLLSPPSLALGANKVEIGTGA